MDNIKLNKEQLILVKQFIKDRGFSSTALTLEIFDHFACKIEELMGEYPDIPFEMVMIIAYKSFGKRGFFTLALAYVNTQKKIYQTKYLHQLKLLAGSIRFIIPLTIAAILFYAVLNWTILHDYRHIVRINDTIAVLFIFRFAVSIYFQINARKHNRYWEKFPSLFWGRFGYNLIYSRSFVFLLLYFYCLCFYMIPIHIGLPLSLFLFILIAWTDTAYYITMTEANEEGDMVNSMYDKVFN